MAQDDDLRTLGKVMHLMRALSLLILLAHCYFYCYPVFSSFGWVHPAANEAIGKIFHSNPNGYFHISKVIAIAFLSLSCIGTISNKSEKVSKTLAFASLIGGLFIYFGNFLIINEKPSLYSLYAYIFTLCIGWGLTLSGISLLKRLMRQPLMDDEFNELNESFMQETKKMENEYSINLPTKFFYNKKNASRMDQCC